ncbi:MAG: hypothetical protein CL840_17250 [Crocinitomicaceae bacterium]|nr:hypothetical protein [Crocinitomicaceae bacterium]|tara:strand:- start:1419 stop:2657 length:1239 start_codon:yes stop_codon:yes gene_type:complete
MRICAIVLVLLTSVCQLQAQLRVSSKREPDSLLMNVLLGNNSSLQITEVKFSGYRHQIGEFKTEFSDYIDITDGVILSTGMVQGARGPNNSSRASTRLGGAGDNELTRIARNKTYDASILEFGFIPSGNHFEFQYVFASEEYPEYVGKGVNDVFAFILTDSTNQEKKNLAILPQSLEAVTVDNVNSHRNNEYFILNGIWEEDNALKWEGNMELGEYAYNFQFDGFTTWLKAESIVIPGHKYWLKIAIADAGDAAYDSAVLLKKNSFKAESDNNEELKTERDELMRYFDTERVIQRGDSLVLVLNLHFDHDKSITNNAEDLENLEEIYQVISRNPKLQLLVEGFTDSRGDVEYNLQLSKRRASFAKDWIIDKGVDITRVNSVGKGMHHPVASNQSEHGRAKNRRVEFVFYLTK